jgi:hypothetical protein
MSAMDLYVTKSSRFALLVMDRNQGYAWMRARGLPALWSRPRRGFLVRQNDLPDIRAICRYERLFLREHHASGPRQAHLRRHHAITNASRRSAA